MQSADEHIQRPLMPTRYHILGCLALLLTLNARTFQLDHPNYIVRLIAIYVMGSSVFLLNSKRSRFKSKVTTWSDSEVMFARGGNTHTCFLKLPYQAIENSPADQNTQPVSAHPPQDNVLVHWIVGINQLVFGCGHTDSTGIWFGAVLNIR